MLKVVPIKIKLATVQRMTKRMIREENKESLMTRVQAIMTRRQMAREMATEVKLEELKTQKNDVTKITGA